MNNPKRPGRWKAGEGGNPAGRKPGSGEVAKMRAAMAEHVPALVAVLVERALGGDVGAARLLLERTIAPLKASEEAAPLAMPDGTLWPPSLLVNLRRDRGPRCWHRWARWRS
jgi:hypothetical protein